MRRGELRQRFRRNHQRRDRSGVTGFKDYLRPHPFHFLAVEGKLGSTFPINIRGFSVYKGSGFELSQDAWCYSRRSKAGLLRVCEDAEARGSAFDAKTRGDYFGCSKKSTLSFRFTLLTPRKRTAL
jgi:hypothetical protein